jgi:tetratricopeptide (TPR) repeat protein
MNYKIYNIPLLMSVVLAMMLVWGCKNEEEKWKETKKSNNVIDYLNFVLKYPESTHATEARSYLSDTIDKMHIKAMDVYRDDQYSDKERKKEALKIYKRILRIDPNDAHALNNAAVLRWMSYGDNPGKNKLQQVKDLLDQSFKNANRRRISNDSLAWISEGGAVYLALPPPDRYKRVPLRDLVYENLSVINYLLDIPRKRPVNPPELIISGIVVDTNDLPVAGRRLWLMGIEGDVDFNNIKTNYIINDEGRCVNPYADTDEKGRFSFRVAYDDRVLDNLPTNFFFITSTSHSKEIFLSKSSPTLSQNGKTLAITIDENTNVVNIGKAYLRGD